MSSKKQIIRIELSVEQTKRYFEIAQKRLTGELEEDCLPSGIGIEIDVIPPFGELVSVEGEDLGQVSFEIIDVE